MRGTFADCLEVASNQSSKTGFFITHVKSSTLLYNMEVVVKPVFLHTARKAKQTCFEECCEPALSKRDHFTALGAGTWQLRTTDTHRAPAVL